MNKTKKRLSALPPLYPSLVVDNETGEVLSKTAYTATIKSLLEYCQSETTRLFAENEIKLTDDIAEYKSNPNAFGREHGYASSYKELPREIRVKSRINELILHKLISETASYVNSPNPHKQPPTFPPTINLGAVNAQMVMVGLIGDELTMSWKCWDKELLLVFNLPAYALQKNVEKVTLPSVKLDKDGYPVFYFVVQEMIVLRTKSKLSAGIDLGRVVPFTMAVTNKRGDRIADYSTSPRLRQLARKQERLRAEKNHLWFKVKAYKELKLDSTILEEHQGYVRNATTRLTRELALQLAAEITRKLVKHPVSILNLEKLSWVSGTKEARVGTTRWAFSQQQAAITHAVLGKGITTKTINPKNTSQLCAKCGIKITAKNRTVWCGECKSILDRDYNAALNIANNINKNKRFPITNGSNGNDYSSPEQVVVHHVPNRAIKNNLEVVKILT